MLLTGAEILIECLKEQGVDTIFGYPGGAVLYIYDALYKYRDQIKHYLTSHEQGAAHAADGYARASGKVGVCLATSGPGATNLVTGIATAYMDSVPMVAITGNVTVGWLGKDSFQEVDITGITMPITKHNFIVKDISKLAETVRRAFYIAKEGRPGPVLIDITKDVTAASYEYEMESPRVVLPKINKIKDEDILGAIKAMTESKRPLIYVGGGVISGDACAELRTFAERLDAPVTSSAMGLGAFPYSDPKFTGMIGMHGTKTSNLAATDCDLLLALGARFSDRVVSNVARFAPKARVIHVDIDPAEINKNVSSYSAVIGDVKEILKRINQQLPQQSHKDWLAAVQDMKVKYPLSYDKSRLTPQFIIEKIFELTKGEAIITTEVGQHQMFTCLYGRFEKPRSFLTSGGLGTMGFGLGASIGASVACPDKTVFNIAGDGCFRMNHIELATAVENDIPIIEVIMNNHALGMVRQWQNMFYDGRYSHTTLSKTTDFIKLAEAYQAEAFHVTACDQVEEVLLKAMSLKKPVVINCEIGQDEKVFPIVPPGAAIDETITD